MTHEFLPGHWYALGWDIEGTGAIQWNDILRYDGDGCWSDDSGEPVYRVWDPDLQQYVAPDGADAYALQG